MRQDGRRRTGHHPPRDIVTEPGITTGSPPTKPPPTKTPPTKTPPRRRRRTRLHQPQSRPHSSTRQRRSRRPRSRRQSRNRLSSTGAEPRRRRPARSAQPRQPRSASDPGRLPPRSLLRRRVDVSLSLDVTRISDQRYLMSLDAEHSRTRDRSRRTHRRIRVHRVRGDGLGLPPHRRRIDVECRPIRPIHQREHRGRIPSRVGSHLTAAVQPVGYAEDPSTLGNNAVSWTGAVAPELADAPIRLTAPLRRPSRPTTIGRNVIPLPPRTLAADLPSYAERAGEPVRLNGWIHRRRRLSGLAFVVLRDRSGPLRSSCATKRPGRSRRFDRRDHSRGHSAPSARISGSRGVEVVDPTFTGPHWAGRDTTDRALAAEDHRRPPHDARLRPGDVAPSTATGQVASGGNVDAWLPRHLGRTRLHRDPDAEAGRVCDRVRSQRLRG